VVHRRPVALAKLSVHTHHLSLFRVRWRLIFFSRSEYNCLIARWTLNINQSINQSINSFPCTWYTVIVLKNKSQPSIVSILHHPFSCYPTIRPGNKHYRWYHRLNLFCWRIYTTLTKIKKNVFTTTMMSFLDNREKFGIQAFQLHDLHAIIQ
jgi:hypothetical protein